MSLYQNLLPFVESDGGRSKYFQAKNVGDCVCRAITIASGRDYLEIYNALREAAKKSRSRKSGTPRSGININTTPFKRLMTELGFVWVPCSKMGVHFFDDEMPLEGRFVCSVAKHCVAVVDGVVYDTWDSRFNSFGEPRRVYGVWFLKG